MPRKHDFLYDTEYRSAKDEPTSISGRVISVLNSPDPEKQHAKMWQAHHANEYIETIHALSRP